MEVGIALLVAPNAPIVTRDFALRPFGRCAWRRRMEHEGDEAIAAYSVFARAHVLPRHLINSRKVGQHQDLARRIERRYVKFKLPFGPFADPLVIQKLGGVRLDLRQQLLPGACVVDPPSLLSLSDDDSRRSLPHTSVVRELGFASADGPQLRLPPTLAARRHVRGLCGVVRLLKAAASQVPQLRRVVRLVRELKPGVFGAPTSHCVDEGAERFAHKTPLGVGVVAVQATRAAPFFVPRGALIVPRA